jgi:hypothetical protein
MWEQFVANRRIAAGAALFFVLLTVATFYHRVEMFDDAWLGEQAYWLAQDGRIRSELFRGFLDWEHHLYVCNKLFVFFEAGLVKLLGFSLYTVKTASALFTGIFLIALYFYYRNRGPGAGFCFMLATTIFLANGLVEQYSFVGRPEMMVMTLGFISFCLLEHYLNGGRTPAFFASALFAGLSTLAHLNGVIFIVAGIGLLLLHRRFAPAARFALIGFSVSLLYFADAAANRDMALMLHQFRYDPATAKAFGLGSKLSVMLGYHKIFFHSLPEISLSILLAVALLAGGRRGFRNQKNALLYLAALLATFFFITKSDYNYYYLLFIPYIAIIATGVYSAESAHHPRAYRIVLPVAMILYLAGGAAEGGSLVYEDLTTPVLAERNRAFAAMMPVKNSSVIAPMYFIFDEIDSFRIHGLTYFLLTDRYPGDPGRSMEDFFARAKAENARYILFDNDRNQGGYKLPPGAPGTIGAYSRIYRDGTRSIYARVY